MSIGDILLSIVIFLIQRLLLPILPTSIPFLPYDSFVATLAGLKTDLTYSLSGLGLLFPADLLLAMILLIIFAETSLFVFRMGKFIINLVRGSGA
jgi:hypothetical protein